jgi:hypothetical protein
VDMMIGTNIDGVVMDMQAGSVARNNIGALKKGRKCWQQKWSKWRPLLTLRH